MPARCPSSRREGARVSAALLLLACVPWTVPLEAQLPPASLVVHAVDAQGQAVSGASLRAGCPGGAELQAATDSRGFALISGLPACALSVTLASPGLPAEGCRDSPRRVAEGETLLLRAVLGPGAGDAAACAFTAVPLDGSVVARQDQDALPRDLPSSRSLWSLLETAEPAAILDRIDGAGLYLGQPGRFSMRGASWTQNTLLLDGLDVTDRSRGGTPLVEPGLGGLQSLEAISALAPVELQAPGVSLALATREPAGSWRGIVEVHGLTQALQASEPAGEAPPIARFGSSFDVDAVATGPLAGERLRGLLSAHAARVESLERDDPARLESRVLSLLGRLAYRPSPRDSLDLLASLVLRRRPFAGGAAFYGGPVSEDADSLGAGLGWTRTASGGTCWARAGAWRGTFTPDSQGHEPGRPVERLLDGPVPELVFPAGSRRTRWSASAGVALRGSRLGGAWQAPRFGLGLDGASAREAPGAGGPLPETVAGLPARVWEYAWGADSRRSARSLVAYAADRLVLRDRLLVEGGLRLEAARGSAAGAAQRVSWTTLSPRLQARLRLSRRGGLSLFGGWGEYTHQLLLEDLAFGDPNAPSAEVYRWSDANGDGRFDPTERGPLVARAGPGTAGGGLSALDPALRPPRTRELVLGLESSPGAGFVVSLTAFDRRERDRIESVDVGVTAADYVVRYLPDPGGDLVGPQDDQLLPVYDRKPESFGLDRYLLTNPPGLAGLHQGVELRVEKGLGRGLSLLAGATASRTEIAGANRGFRVVENDQGLVGELLDDPNADTHASGRGFFDRAYTLKVALAWRSRRELRAGVVARYQDGQPFGRLVVVPDLAQGPEAIPATPRGQLDGGSAGVPSGHRFSYTLTVDARLEQDLRLGSRRLALIAEAFNLLGARNEVEEDAVFGPAFRTPTAVQPPRVFSFGLRLDF